MINNICDKKNKIYPNIFDWSLWLNQFEEEYEKEQFIDFAKKITNVLRPTSKKYDASNISYVPTDLIHFIGQMARNKEQWFYPYRFISNFDLIKLAEMIYKCSA